MCGNTKKQKNRKTEKPFFGFFVFKFFRLQSGFTIIEVLIAIAIVSVLASLSVAYFNSFLARNELKNESIKIIDFLRRARGFSMAGQEDSQWGVHFETSKYVLFKGTAYSVSGAFNEEVSLPAVLTISTINLGGGGSEVIFNKITGETLNFGTTTISNDIGESKNITINLYGNVEIR